jgi:hypothetical protein
MTNLPADRQSAVRPRRAKHELSAVTATALGEHLGLSRQRISALADEGVIERLPDGRFNQDRARLGYLAWLRDPARRSARSEAASDLEKAKAALVWLRVREREGKLMETSEAVEVIKEMVGLFRTHLSGLGTQVSRDLPTRRAIDAAVNALLHRIADEGARRAKGFGEPGKPTTGPTIKDADEDD